MADPTPQELFEEYARRGNTPSLEGLFDTVHVDTQGTLGNTALIWAASGGHGDTVDVLCQMGANVNIQNDVGDTALHKAAYRGYPEIVDSLLRAGANKKMANNEGKTAVDFASTVEVKELLPGIAVSCGFLFDRA
jgi:ankyrin repeat protein